MKILTTCYLVFLVVLVILANSDVRPWDAVPCGDKLGHFALVGVLSFLLNATMRAAKVRVFSFTMLKANLLLVMAVTVEEFSQLWIPSRTFSLVDLACNYAGIVCFGHVAVRWVGLSKPPES